MEFIVLGVFAVLICIVLYLYDRYADVRWRLDGAQKDAVRWKEEAVKRGYKNPFEEVIDTLRQTAEKLETVAEVMKRTTEIQKASTERLRELNAKLRETNANMAAVNADLEKAGRHFAAAAPPRLPPPPARLSQPAAKPQVRQAKDLNAGFVVEPDPRKRN